jgi:hypothetical protein
MTLTRGLFADCTSLAAIALVAVESGCRRSPNKFERSG